MPYGISASINGQYESLIFLTLTEAVAVADEWAKVASTPVRFKKMTA